MDSSNTEKSSLIWKDEYSVNVKEIDEQHKNLFVIINKLIEAINKVPNEKSISEIIKKIVDYKLIHFATEEKYFHQFNYEGTEEHEAAHQSFNNTLASVQEKYQGDVISLAFALVDYLEDWLIEHLITMDQKYKKCFNNHGLY